MRAVASGVGRLLRAQPVQQLEGGSIGSSRPTTCCLSETLTGTASRSVSAATVGSGLVDGRRMPTRLARLWVRPEMAVHAALLLLLLSALVPVAGAPY